MGDPTRLWVGGGTGVALSSVGFMRNGVTDGAVLTLTASVAAATAEVAGAASVGVSGAGVVVTIITVGTDPTSGAPGADKRSEPTAYKPRQNTPEQPKPSITPMNNHCQLLSRVRPRNELIIGRSPLNVLP